MLKRMMIRILCLGIMAAGFWSVNNMLSGKAAEIQSPETIEPDSGDTAAAFARTAGSRVSAYDSALSSLWSLDQTMFSEEVFIAAAEMARENEKDAVAEEVAAESDESEYADLAIANVRDYVNVRSLPSTEGKVLGKIYNGAVAQILDVAGDGGEWFHVTSGSVEGYIKAEYFLYGDAAAEVIDNYVTRKVQVKADRLNVRAEADITAKRTGFLDCGEKALLLEDCGDWKKIRYAEEKEGYVSAEFVTMVEEFVYAKSIEEELAEKKAQEELRKRTEIPEEKAPENTNVFQPETTYSASGDLRADIVNFAMQYLGNRYIMGGNSLANGTDCSGFTSLIYAEFGYSISRTPSGQCSSAGRGIDYSEIQPGDIICYSSNGGKSCTHVALYIGDGQIIHSANSRKGVVIYQAGYDRIIGVRNVID